MQLIQSPFNSYCQDIIVFFEKFIESYNGYNPECSIDFNQVKNIQGDNGLRDGKKKLTNNYLSSLEKSQANRLSTNPNEVSEMNENFLRAKNFWRESLLKEGNVNLLEEKKKSVMIAVPAVKESPPKKETPSKKDDSKIRGVSNIL
jgi:hypothetical protein